MKKYTGLIILAAAIVTYLCLDTAGTFSKFISTSRAATGIGVAVPIFENSVETLSVELDEMKPGSVKYYEFYVTNENDTSISDITLEYDISIERSTNLPLTFELYKDNVNTNILSTDLISAKYLMNHSVSSVHNYKLVIDWNSSYSDSEYQKLIESVDINIRAIQKIV